MRTVIFVLAAIVAVNAQNTCVRTPAYTETIDPVVCPRVGIQLPNYEDAQTYYTCAKAGGNGTLVTCTNGEYFSYVRQSCASCDTYLPSAPCSSLPFEANCVAIGSVTPPATTASTAAPTVSTASTAAPTTNTTSAAPTTQAPTTTPGVPEPPTEAPGTTSSGSSGDDTPSGTTIFIPQPPSPGESNVPTPVTPVPTAPNLDPTPPIAQEPNST